MASFQRVALLRAIRDRLEGAPDLAAVPVSIGPPRDDSAGARQLWLYAGTGEVAVAGMRSGRKTMDDTFEVYVWCVAHVDGAPDGEQASADAEDLAGVVHDTIADDVSVSGEGLDHVLAVTLDRANGPTPVPYDVGYSAVVEVVLEAKVRMR